MAKPPASPPSSDIGGVHQDGTRPSKPLDTHGEDGGDLNRPRAKTPPAPLIQTRNPPMTEPNSSSNNPDAIWTTIAKLHVCMLATEEEGHLVSRPMASLARPEDGKIYFITHLQSGKVGEIGGSAP
jgi:hypothetical protein